jgi:hypothetical protein
MLPVHRRRAAGAALILVIALLTLLGAGAAVAKRGPGGTTPTLSPDEKAFAASLDDAYAWEVMLKQVYGWGTPNYDPWFNETVGGTAGSLKTVNALAAEMARIGLEPGAANGTFVEDFPIDGWEDLGSSVTVVSPYTRTIAPCKQAYKGAGTGPGGVTAELVDVGYGRWDDFEAAGDINGKIVLLHRADPMFYGGPSLAEAKARGAVGALMDYPMTDPEILKTDEIAEFIPTMYIRQIEWDQLAADLAAGKDLEVKLVVDNEVGDYPMAHNVVGTIPGSVYPNEYVYLGCHFDHWITSAADDGAGVGSMFAIAKALKAMQADGWQPQRTIVFAAFDSEELGGPPDTWYDWCLGSFSHIVGQLPGGSNPAFADTYKEWDDTDLLPATRGDRAGKIVAMLNMDVIGVKNATVYVESTPDVTAFFKKCAKDSGLVNVAKTWVYWPPSSYDDWQFYMAGVPCMEIAFWGPVYDKLYHTTGDVPSVLDPKAIRANMMFNGLALLRFDRAGVQKYDLQEDLNVAEIGIANLVSSDKSVFAPGKADMSALQAGMDEYAAVLAEKAGVLAGPAASADEAARVNGIQMAASKALLPHLFDWDSSGIPGWTGIFLFDTYANDLAVMNKAIAQLELRKAGSCAATLSGVTTMGWGQYVGDEAYDLVMEHIAYNPHLLWGYGYIPQLTDVHREYMSLTGRYAAGGMTQDEVLQSLIAKRDAIYGSVTLAAGEVGAAYSEAAAILGEL